METKRTMLVDAETGEIVEYKTVLVRKRSSYDFAQFGVFPMQAFEKLSEIKSLEQFRVLMLLISELDYENWIKVKQTRIADRLGMKPPHVTRAINALVAQDVLLRGPERSLRFNPAYGWRGSAKSHTKALNSRATAAGLIVLDGGKS